MWITRIFYVAFMMIANSMVDAGTIDTGEQEPFEQCGYCHEYDGNSVMPNYPKLAGQQETYLIKQLLDFKKGKRKGLMQATAELLTEQDINSVATYFSQQTANSVNHNTSIASDAFTGVNNIFMKGDAKRGLIACVSCHSAKIDNSGSDSAIPELFGQHEMYIAKQLISFKTGQRSNDQDGVMRSIAKKLTFPEIRNMAKLLSRFAPVKNDTSFVSNKTNNGNKSERKQ